MLRKDLVPEIWGRVKKLIDVSDGHHCCVYIIIGKLSRNGSYPDLRQFQEA